MLITWFGFGKASSHDGPGVKPGGPMRGKPRMGVSGAGRIRCTGWAAGPGGGGGSAAGGKFWPVWPTRPSQRSATVHDTQPGNRQNVTVWLCASNLHPLIHHCFVIEPARPVLIVFWRLICGCPHQAYNKFNQQDVLGKTASSG